jgi:hypothetical protein
MVLRQFQIGAFGASRTEFCGIRERIAAKLRKGPRIAKRRLQDAAPAVKIGPIDLMGLDIGPNFP